MVKVSLQAVLIWNLEVLAGFVNQPRLRSQRLHPERMWSRMMMKAQIFMLAIALMLCLQSVAMAKAI